MHLYFFCSCGCQSRHVEVARHALRRRYVEYVEKYASNLPCCVHHRQISGCGIHSAYGGISTQHNLFACGASVGLFAPHLVFVFLNFAKWPKYNNENLAQYSVFSLFLLLI